MCPFDTDASIRCIEISPVHLPTSHRGPVAFDELRRIQAFEGLPGVLADALPDSFGNKVIRAWFAARGQAERALSPVQRLLYVGQRALLFLFNPEVKEADWAGSAVAAVAAEAAENNFRVLGVAHGSSAAKAQAFVAPINSVV